jgi:copper chaperone NosL
MNRLLLTTWTALLAALLYACTTDSASNPSGVDYGKDTCSRCGNVIQDARFAAQYSLADGTVEKFDDPGCLVQSLEAERTEPRLIYLRTYRDDRWVEAKEAWLARSSGIVSPRGYGWAAFASFGPAQETVTGHGDGELLRFEDARKKIAQASGG